MSKGSSLSNDSPSLRLVHGALLAVLSMTRTLLHRLLSLGSSQTPKSTITTSRNTLASRIPRGSWDSHMHVLDPRFKLSQSALYKPNWHTVSDAEVFEGGLGIDKVVIVQPSIYGNDNSCTLDGLRTLGPDRARAVVVFDPAETPVSVLEEWHRLGVRGVRINLQSVGKSPAKEELESTFKKYADVVRPFGWVIQVYAALPMIEMLESIIPHLGVRVCIDHIGHPILSESVAYQKKGDPYALPGFASLIRLLEGKMTYVKLSAAYRFSNSCDGITDVLPIVREILNVAGHRRVVFATDWPHTRFEGMDIRPWVETALDLCEDDDLLVERIFKGNAHDLWNPPRE